jgi:hypothetical protein
MAGAGGSGVVSIYRLVPLLLAFGCRHCYLTNRLAGHLSLFWFVYRDIS